MKTNYEVIDRPNKKLISQKWKRRKERLHGEEEEVNAQETQPVQEESFREEINCPDCYGGHFRPCQMCGDSGRVVVSRSTEYIFPIPALKPV